MDSLIVPPTTVQAWLDKLLCTNYRDIFIFIDLEGIQDIIWEKEVTKLCV